MTATTTTDIIHERLREFITLDKEERELDARLKAIKQRKAELEPSLLDGMIEGKVQNARIDGLTVYVHSQLWAGAKGGDRVAACQALRAAGLGDMVQDWFNTNTLSAYVRELAEKGEPLPPALDSAIEVTERFSLRTVKAARAS